MNEFFIIFAGILILFLIGVAWIWNHLMRQVRELAAMQEELVTVFDHRRDSIPYLIESYRAIESSPSKTVQSIIGQRANTSAIREFKELWEKEKALEAMLEKLFNEARDSAGLQKDIGWLEAENEVREDTEAITEHAGHYETLRTYIDQKTQKFPYAVFKNFVEKRI